VKDLSLYISTLYSVYYFAEFIDFISEFFLELLGEVFFVVVNEFRNLSQYVF